MTAKRPPDHPSSRAVHNSQLHNFFSQFIKKGISGKTVEIGEPTMKKYDYWSFSHQKTKKNGEGQNTIRLLAQKKEVYWL